MSEAVQSILEQIQRLPVDERVELAAEVDRLSRNVRPTTSLRGIEPVTIGRILRPLSPDDDLLEEMGA